MSQDTLWAERSQPCLLQCRARPPFAVPVAVQHPPCAQFYGTSVRGWARSSGGRSRGQCCHRRMPVAPASAVPPWHVRQLPPPAQSTRGGIDRARRDIVAHRFVVVAGGTDQSGSNGSGFNQGGHGDDFGPVGPLFGHQEMSAVVWRGCHEAVCYGSASKILL